MEVVAEVPVALELPRRPERVPKEEPSEAHPDEAQEVRVSGRLEPAADEFRHSGLAQRVIGPMKWEMTGSCPFLLTVRSR